VPRRITARAIFDYVDYFTFTDKLGILTANATTPYFIGFPNVAEFGPLVMEFRPARSRAESWISSNDRWLTCCTSSASCW
jgi:hypothetical protein